MAKPPAPIATPATGSLDINNLAKPWTKRQYKFVLAYLSDPELNATRAMIKAGFSKKGADAAAARMLGHIRFKHIQDFIKLRLTKIVDELEISADKTLRHLASMAYSNMLDYLDFDDLGQPKLNLQKATRDQMAAVSKIKIKQMEPVMQASGEQIFMREVTQIEINLWDKNKAEENLMRHQGLLVDKPVEINLNFIDKMMVVLTQKLQEHGVDVPALIAQGNAAPAAARQIAPPKGLKSSK